MNKIKIPKEFQLFGYVIKVEYDKEMRHKYDFRGQSRLREHIMYLQPTTEGVCLLPEQIEQTFFHELTHFILNALGETDLGDNEKFVDNFASLLHQVFKTAKY